MSEIGAEALGDLEVCVGEEGDFDSGFEGESGEVVWGVRRNGEDSEAEVVYAAGEVLPTDERFFGAWAEGTAPEE